jgi:hypothetical protein
MANTRNVGIWVNLSDRTNHEPPTGRNDGFVSMVSNEITFHPPVDMAGCHGSQPFTVSSSGWIPVH